MRYSVKKLYICQMIMNKPIYLLFVGSLVAMVACSSPQPKSAPVVAPQTEDILVVVNDKVLTRDDFYRDMPAGLTGVDSITFAKMYVDTWVIKQLKMSRAGEVLPTYEESIERLVEDYRQSLIMRQLDQYYIDNDIDHEVTDEQIMAYYRANSASFKLNHHKVRGVIVKAPKEFPNTKSLTTALNTLRTTKDTYEIMALAEKLSLQVIDLSQSWETYNDFLGNLPTVRTRNYDNLLSTTTAQNLSSDDATFYFIFTDVARKGSVAPLESVEEDIKRRLYAERRSAVVLSYEDELRREAVEAGMIIFHDELLEDVMGYGARIEAMDKQDEVVTDDVLESVQESVEEEEPIVMD